MYVCVCVNDSNQEKLTLSFPKSLYRKYIEFKIIYTYVLKVLHSVAVLNCLTNFVFFYDFFVLFKNYPLSYKIFKVQKTKITSPTYNAF
jgi:hypothetical protein